MLPCLRLSRRIDREIDVADAVCVEINFDFGFVSWIVEIEPETGIRRQSLPGAGRVKRVVYSRAPPLA